MEPLTFANLWQSYRIPTLFSTSFRFFFFFPSTSKCSAFAGPLSSSILSTCPNHRHLCSLRNSSNLSILVIARIFSLFVLSFKVFPYIICNILISVALPFLWSERLVRGHERTKDCQHRDIFKPKLSCLHCARCTVYLCNAAPF